MVDHCCDTHVLVVHFYVFRKVACSNSKLIGFELSSLSHDQRYPTLLCQLKKSLVLTPWLGSAHDRAHSRDDHVELLAL